MNTKQRIEELERRVRELEARPIVYPPVFVPYPVPVPPTPPLYPSPFSPPWFVGDVVPVSTPILPTACGSYEACGGHVVITSSAH